MATLTDTKASGRTEERELPQVPFGAPHVFVLLTVDGPSLAGLHRLAKMDSVIGREDNADFRLSDEAISGAHVRIRVEGSVCTIMDLDSLNGTWLNGKPLRPRVSQRLRHLDEIRVGDTRLLVLSGRFRPADRSLRS